MIANPGYETAAGAAQPGLAANWVTTTVNTVEQTAEFEGDSILSRSGYESFDHGWGPDPERLDSSMVDAEVEKRAIERFERDWFVAQGFMFLSALESATFSAASFETFDTGWGTIDQDMQLSTGELAHAAFGAQAIESFDADWGATGLTLGSVDTCMFDAGGLSTSSSSPSSAEQFTLKLRQRVRPNVGADTLTAVNPPLLLAVGDAVTLVAENGELPEPFAPDVTYVVHDFGSDSCKLAPFPEASVVDITSDGSGANYVVADPGRFWLDEL